MGRARPSISPRQTDSCGPPAHMDESCSGWVHSGKQSWGWPRWGQANPQTDRQTDGAVSCSTRLATGFPIKSRAGQVEHG